MRCCTGVLELEARERALTAGEDLPPLGRHLRRHGRHWPLCRPCCPEGLQGQPILSRDWNINGISLHSAAVSQGWLGCYVSSMDCIDEQISTFDWLQVFANDLNPDSHRYLLENVRRNKVADSVEVSNEDGRAFIRRLSGGEAPSHALCDTA